MQNRQLLLAFILSAILALLIGILSNLAAAYLTPALANRAIWVYSALIITFIISLPISYYLLTQSITTSGSPSGPHISQVAKGGRIEESPIEVAKDSPARVDVRAENEGTIEGSGVTIK